MSKKKPNVLFITFDCLRPDRLSGLGYRGTRTPAFDRAMEEGVTFTNAYCQAPNTWISHGSLFTGCNPYLHGVRTPLQRISDAIPTMAELFRAGGYATFGLPAMSLLSEEAGFARGFDTYRLDQLQSEEGILSHRYHRSAADTLEMTRDWLRAAERPFLAWIHYFGIHKMKPDLLDLPAAYRSQYSEYAQYYDGKVVFADERFLAPLRQELEELGILDETILVLWSDHGDDLHLIEHDAPQAGHNWSLSEAVMRTTLIIRAPWLLPGGVRRDDVIQSVDLLPSLLEMAGLDRPPDLFEGRSIVTPAAQGEPVVYMENLCQGFVGMRRGRHKLVLSQREQCDSRGLSGKVRRRLRLIAETTRGLMPSCFRGKKSPLQTWWRARGEPGEILDRLLAKGVPGLYDLCADPAGVHDVAAAHPQLVSELRQSLRHLTTGSARPQAAYATERERQEVEDRLRYLGYL